MKRSRKCAMQYVAGCNDGYRLGFEWHANPRRGDASFGGTLQDYMLDLAGQLAAATSPEARARVRGVIVGFCVAVELPAYVASFNDKASSRHRGERGIDA